MAINTETLYRKLFDNLFSAGYRPHAKDATSSKDVVPEKADYLQFDVEPGEGTTPVTLSVEKTDNGFGLTVYYSDDAKKNASEEWYNILKDLRYTARTSGINTFNHRNSDHLGPDMQKRTYMKQQEQLAEGYHAMGKKASYSDAVPAVKIVLQHTRQIEEGEQRYRNIAKIFVENQNGERFLIPTTKPGIARVYARHISEGGTPYDERGQHITGLVEEYSKMSGFVRATRGHQFNESAQKLVESGIAHYESLRETLSRMTGRRGYSAYFESWTPPLMEDDSDTTAINELFVQETLDPRIESVMPILSRLNKTVAEMKEVDALSEWADSLTEAPGAETLSHNQSTEKQNLKSLGLAEDGDDLQEPAIDELDEYDGPAVTAQKNSSSPAMRGSPAMAHYAAQLDSELDEEESLTSNNPVGIPEAKKANTKTARKEFGNRVKAKPTDKEQEQKKSESDEAWERLMAYAAAQKEKEKTNEVQDAQFHEEVDLGQYDAVKTPLTGKDTADWDKNFREKLKQYTKELDQRQKEKAEKVDEDEFAGDFKTGPAGQWRNKGPKANKPAQVGDLVGASESVESQDTMLEGQDDLDAIMRIVKK